MPAPAGGCSLPSGGRCCGRRIGRRCAEDVRHPRRRRRRSGGGRGVPARFARRANSATSFRQRVARGGRCHHRRSDGRVLAWAGRKTPEGVVMNIDRMKAELRRDEGERLTAYPDPLTGGEPWTIGVGHTGGIKPGQTCTPEQSDAWLGQDIAETTADLDRALPWWRGLSETRQRALLNMAFNMGVPRLLGFRGMLAALQAGDYERAALEAFDSRWALQVGDGPGGREDRADRIAEMIREG
ncbi:Lysozyme (modular protein) [uncultured Alphaproteobacteria bacterium]|uniref:Lysozyme n=1 Tax=uncultured Alphaproteobacteria bacterium TaxID=91750 RepID=A0A212KM50_9PROT|nr:Lysozyme (modular protein) [uncultured Alphaproteobacteria bacterium]